MCHDRVVSEYLWYGRGNRSKLRHGVEFSAPTIRRGHPGTPARSNAAELQANSSGRLSRHTIDMDQLIKKVIASALAGFLGAVVVDLEKFNG